MNSTTLYEQLSVSTQRPGVDHGRTERTADDRETIDNDRLVVDLYATLGNPVVADGSEDVGRTEGSRDTRETIDKDRAGLALNSTLIGPPTDLYDALVHLARKTAADQRETALTASTETIDYDQPPDFPYT